MRAPSAVVLLLAACEPDGGLKVYNNPPEVAFSAPADGTTVAAGAWVTFEAQVQDYQDDLSALELVWKSSDGSTPEGTLSYVDGGVVYVVEGFAAGDPTITLQAIDTMGDEGDDSVTLHVIANEPPSPSFLAPVEGAVVLAEDPVRVELAVTDPDEVDLTDVSLEWGDAAAEVGAPTSPDSAGGVTFYLSDLPAGSTLVSVTVTDTLGASVTEIVGFEVVLADADFDGHRDIAWGGDDCDDADPTIHPGADEACDGVDHDCDGAVDEDDATDAATWYEDADGDGYGAPASWSMACAQPDGFVADDTDCDDGAEEVHPGATEACGGTDEDCDGAVDESGATGETAWYADGDGDGFGAAASVTSACDAPAGFLADATDCDDTDSGVSPAGTETCDGEDDDCDGTVDEDDATDAATWYVDVDGDGAGGGTTTQACAQPVGATATSTDCDDGDAGVYPGADEHCDLEDDDCDGVVDEDDAVDAPTWYLDTDADGYGDTASTTACTVPSGYAAYDGDCDDGDAAYHPGAAEADCADPNDYNCDGSNGYADADGDGWAACEECDDGASAVSPDATEACNGVDDDCDGTVDEDDAVDASTWYADSDADAYGDPTSVYLACDQPYGYVADAEDCDDGDSGVSPTALEQCDGEDDDCDGTVDEDSAVDAGTWYADTDGDTYGDPAVTDTACSAPSNYVANADDCDDTDSGVSPGDVETCDGEDDDCDGTVDESAVDADTWYADTDGDSYGDPASSVAACAAPATYVANDDDCDDTDSGVSPADLEYCDGEDDDCDGAVDEDSAVDADIWYADADGDSFGDPTTTQAACSAPAAYVADATDCDDGRLATNPDAPEECNGEDDNCDGAVDEDAAVDAGRWYLDDDGDGFGQTAVWVVACDEPAGYAAEADDCDDGDASASPYADEYCDGYDNNCNGTVDEGTAVDSATWYADLDGDTYGDPSSSLSACTAPSSYVADNDDCDDASSAVSPADPEVCDAADTDEDCDGLADDADPSTSSASESTFYVDADVDGYGGTTAVSRCDADATFVATNTDCDDGDPDVSPGETEVCDALDTDEDCDGVADPSCGAYGGSYAADASPTASSDADAVIYGELTADYFGESIASGIDLDNDGYEDVAIGASGNTRVTTSSYYGSIFVYDDGLPTGTNDADTNDVARLYGSTIAAYAIGGAIWPLQDIDDDGYDELAFQYYADTFVWEGENIYGEQSFTNNELDAERYPEGASTLGHIRNNTTTYLGLSFTFTSTYGGQVALFYKSGSTLVQGSSIIGEDTYDYAGCAFAGGDGNDTNGDGYDDIFIGATGDDVGGSAAGAVYVVESPIDAHTDLATAAIKIAGSAADDALGTSVVAPGDVDGDGVPDLVTGAAGDDDGGSGSGVLFLFGDVNADASVRDNDATDYEAKFIGDAAGDALGTVTPVFGDVDGDGEIDALMSSPSWTNGTIASAGAAWLVYGPLAGVYDLSTDYSARFTGDSSSDACGAAVGLSDMDADGADDIIVGCTYGDVDGHTHFGTAWFFAGM